MGINLDSRVDLESRVNLVDLVPGEDLELVSRVSLASWVNL